MSTICLVTKKSLVDPEERFAVLKEVYHDLLDEQVEAHTRFCMDRVKQRYEKHVVLDALEHWLACQDVKLHTGVSPTFAGLAH